MSAAREDERSWVREIVEKRIAEIQSEPHITMPFAKTKELKHILKLIK
jgi:hypothetical protein